jgi:DNA-binding transcriptional ArsR family regulator
MGSDDISLNGASQYTRAGVAAASLARALLVEHPGSRLPTVSEFAQELGTGVGTVQRALKMLEEGGSIRLEPRGRLGTFLADMDRPKLWETSGTGLLLGLMPLPYTRRYEGLATGLRASVEELGVPFSLAFMSGAETRIKALKPGNFSVVSKLAAKRMKRRRSAIREIVDFGPDTFVEGHSLVWATKAKRKHPRVGIDLESPDQVEFAEREFGDDAELIDIPYLQVVDQLRAGAFDVAIWARDALQDIGDLEVTEFTSEAARAVIPLNTTAVMVAPSSDSLTSALVENELDVEQIVRIQREVIDGTRPPRY